MNNQINVKTEVTVDTQFFTSLVALFLIIFVEGFITIGVEILTIRQLMPVVGNSVIVTSFIIGIFLLFLALGYLRGGKHVRNLKYILKNNFTKAALLLGVGLSYVFIIYFFALLEKYISTNLLVLLPIYLLLVTAPMVYILGQTVPITISLYRSEQRVGAISGNVLFVSTLGSFLGAVLTTLLLINFFGVAWTVFFNFCLLLFLIAILFSRLAKEWSRWVLLGVSAALIFQFNVGFEKNWFISTTNYANYRISENYIHKNRSGKMLNINEALSSFLDNKKKGFDYIETIKSVLFHDLKLKDKQILVLGAGGFSLSAENDFGNNFTYVDIDKTIADISSPDFIDKINGQFIHQDARIIARKSQKKYDVIVSDAYTSRNSLPDYLLTREHFNNVKKLLVNDGLAVFNVIANPQLTDSYSKRVDNTIRAVFGNCMVIPLQYTSDFSNIIYVCKKAINEDDSTLYVDNKNSATLDAFRGN